MDEQVGRVGYEQVGGRVLSGNGREKIKDFG